MPVLQGGAWARAQEWQEHANDFLGPFRSNTQKLQHGSDS